MSGGVDDEGSSCGAAGVHIHHGAKAPTVSSRAGNDSRPLRNVGLRVSPCTCQSSQAHPGPQVHPMPEPDIHRIAEGLGRPGAA